MVGLWRPESQSFQLHLKSVSGNSSTAEPLPESTLPTRSHSITGHYNSPSLPEADNDDTQSDLQDHLEPLDRVNSDGLSLAKPTLPDSIFQHLTSKRRTKARSSASTSTRLLSVSLGPSHPRSNARRPTMSTSRRSRKIARRASKLTRQSRATSTILCSQQSRRCGKRQ